MKLPWSQKPKRMKVRIPITSVTVPVERLMELRRRIENVVLAYQMGWLTDTMPDWMGSSAIADLRDALRPRFLEELSNGND